MPLAIPWFLNTTCNVLIQLIDHDQEDRKQYIYKVESKILSNVDKTMRETGYARIPHFSHVPRKRI